MPAILPHLDRLASRSLDSLANLEVEALNLEIADLSANGLGLAYSSLPGGDAFELTIFEAAPSERYASHPLHAQHTVADVRRAVDLLVALSRPPLPADPHAASGF